MSPVDEVFVLVEPEHESSFISSSMFAVFAVWMVFMSHRHQ